MSQGTERIFDLSDGAAHLRMEYDQLVIERPNESPFQAPVEDVAVLILAQKQLTITQAVLARLAAAGGVVVVCDERHLPVSMALPLYGHSLQMQRLTHQMGASLPLKKRLWQQLVVGKIRNQSSVLIQMRGEDEGLSALSNVVASGDALNHEAQAARRYWPKLTGMQTFRRDPDGNAPNHLFNYGYAILRAIVARAVCASALHPTIGLHHHHRDNSFCLADDLMEPFRPIVDRVVMEVVSNHVADAPLNRNTKTQILSALLGRVIIDGEKRTVFDAATRMSAALARSFETRIPNVPIPLLLFGSE